MSDVADFLVGPDKTGFISGKKLVIGGISLLFQSPSIVIQGPGYLGLGLGLGIYFGYIRLIHVNSISTTSLYQFIYTHG